MGAPYNHPIIPRSIHDGKGQDALTSASQLGIMRRKLYVMPRGRTSRRLNALRRNWASVAKHENIKVPKKQTARASFSSVVKQI